MIVRKPLLAAVTLAIAFAASAAFAAGETPAAPSATQVAAAITKEQAVEMALKAHPGKVTKAYEDAHKGKQTWEVKITGDDGRKWKVYYEMSTGALVDDKEDK
ncbi:MAG: PepSY domain-containing protein [Synechococcaceae cyanobacterium SM1_2_3]|nr:PepSY domain-containing protein [Synechococcaceae cyanobacterium SM1_2_3]